MVAGTRRLEVDRATNEAVVAAFSRAAIGGALPSPMTALDPAITLTSDGGGGAGARQPCTERTRVARMLVGLAKLLDADHQPLLATVNDAPALAELEGDECDLVISLHSNATYLQISAGKARRALRSFWSRPTRLPYTGPKDLLNDPV